MEFSYPYKDFFYGKLFYYLVAFYGVIALKSEFKEYPWLFLTYVILIVGIGTYYDKKIKFYKSFEFRHEKEVLNIKQFGKIAELTNSEIEIIIYAEHIVRWKLHKVIHIYDVYGNDFIVTNEIKKFKKLNSFMAETYGEKYYKHKRLVYGRMDEKEDFLKALPYKDMMNLRRIISNSTKK